VSVVEEGLVNILGWGLGEQWRVLQQRRMDEAVKAEEVK
jgi:hypothetical protein